MKRKVIRGGDASNGSGHATVADAVYADLREDLLAGVYEPGARLYSDALQTAYDCGVSPLREALSRLSSERFVARSGQKGFQVAEASLDEVWDITRIRQLVECESIRQSIAAGDTAWESGIVAAYYELSKALPPHATPKGPDEWELRHRKFHKAILAACPSPWLHYVTDLLHAHSERYRRTRLDLMSDASLQKDALAEHKRLMEITLERDADAASEMLARHIEQTAQVVAQALNKEIASA